MSKLAQWIDVVNRKLGEWVSWLMIAMVVITFIIVVLRYVFSLGWVWMQEIVMYMHACVFLLASAKALQNNAHVRVDIFYQSASPKRKALVDAFGSLFFLLPVCGLIFYQAYPFVRDSWSVFEGSKDGGGLEAVFLLKTVILVFAFQMFFQGLSTLVHSIETIKGGDRG